jgi:hypothetical protein
MTARSILNDPLKSAMSQRPPEMDEELYRVLQKAKIELAPLDHGPFSVEGFKRLNQIIHEYVAELVSESVRVAERCRSDSVSPAYVDEASQHLVSGTKAKWTKLVGTIGGTIFGMGLTNVVTMVTTNLYSAKRIVFSVVAIVIGLVAVTYHVLRE